MKTEKLIDIGPFTMFSTSSFGPYGEVVTYHWSETITQRSFGPFSTIVGAMQHYNTIKETEREESKDLIKAFSEKYHHLLHVGAKDTVTYVDFKNKRKRLGDGELY